MATAVEPRTRSAFECERRFLLPGVGWEGYEALLDMIGDGHTRVTYDRGDAELMSPSNKHDEYAELIGRIIIAVTENLRVPCRALRSTTWRKFAVEGGLEADNSYYVTNVPRVRGRRILDLAVDPPPDLAVEIEISHSALNRLRVYAGLRVPEVWRFDGEQLVIHRLQPDGQYATRNDSLEIPAITADEIVHWTREGEAEDNHTEWALRLRDWIQEELFPRYAERRENL